MMSRLDSHGQALDAVQRIVVFRALQLGDLLVAVPALRALRARFPRAEITLLGLPWAHEFVQRFPRYVDRYVEFPGYPGIDEAPVNAGRTARFIADQRQYGYDLALQMHGSGRTSNPFVAALGARITAGYYEGVFPTILALGAPYPHDQHEIYRNLGLVSLLGARGPLDPRLEYPLYAQDHEQAASLLHTLPEAFGGCPRIGLHPGARPLARRWPAEYFAAVADTLAHHYGAQIILTGGPGEEEIVQTVLARMQTPALNLAGRTSLGGLAALIHTLDLFISNDTGPAHLAHAVDCPSITIFGPADYQRWAPLDHSRHPAIRHLVPCSPCGHWICPIDHRCLRRITPHNVLQVAHRLLSPATTLVPSAGMINTTMREGVEPPSGNLLRNRNSI